MIQGLLRLYSAEAAFSRLMCALIGFRSLSKAEQAGLPVEVMENLSKVPHDSYDALGYVTNLSHFVYATTLLDTFISDTTLFLYLLNPKSLGKNQQLPLHMLIDASSREDAICRLATKRVREVSFSPFSARIDVLSETFGLDIQIKDDDLKELAHYSSIRNTVVHDQGIFELALKEGGGVIARQKTCSMHPTHVSHADFEKAVSSYRAIAKEVARAVFVQVLKEPEPGFLQAIGSPTPQ